MRVGILHELPLFKKVDFPVLFDGIFQKNVFRVDEALISTNMKGCIQERRQEQWPLKSKGFAREGVTLLTKVDVLRRRNTIL